MQDSSRRLMSPQRSYRMWNAEPAVDIR